MGESEHTPGPWSVSWKDSRQQSEYYWEVPIRVGSEANAGNSLCRVYMGGPGAIYSNRAVVEANARLIAAAPELLEALKAAKETIRVWHGPEAWDIYDRASPEMKAINSAIAKAEGRS